MSKYKNKDRELSVLLNKTGASWKHFPEDIFFAKKLSLGLSYVRVSPDHGTAKDLIGLGKADPTSLIKSINFISKI